MNDAVLEIVEFRISGHVEPFVEAARNMEAWLRSQPGFRWRRLAEMENGAFLDVIEWADLTSAKAAAEQIMTAAPVAGFMALIDGPTVVTRHARIAVVH